MKDDAMTHLEATLQILKTPSEGDSPDHTIGRAMARVEMAIEALRTAQQPQAPVIYAQRNQLADLIDGLQNDEKWCNPEVMADCILTKFGVKPQAPEVEVQIVPEPSAGLLAKWAHDLEYSTLDEEAEAFAKNFKTIPDAASRGFYVGWKLALLTSRQAPVVAVPGWESRWSFEPHGPDGQFALYEGRTRHTHGKRLCNLSDFDGNREDTLRAILTGHALLQSNGGR